ncbi:flagellar motor protein MotB [Brevibacillus humidisoli]|uniref:flagellar motor protein MotB n=1 Tax=Brevibacillus humidisoli TaxID=2895522 RepID=UPI001E2B26F6|nr:flagellar motor protein MotB [Brevibacillus humidisoli]UFJ41179.1 flagellar motor protein MotB [Brevibacillus humidisoli]
MARRKKKHQHEEHIDETWLIPYADLLTLLLALFIVLFASSKLDAQKFDQLVQSLKVAFNGGTGFFQSPNPMPAPPNAPVPTVEMKHVQTKEEQEQERKFQQETRELQKLKEQLDNYIEQNGLKDKLETKITDLGLLITILDNALFDSGSAVVRPEARHLAAEISKLLEPQPREVTVAGHTDNVPINTREFPSNWELSSKRALNFMKILLENEKLDPRKFSATGYGEYRPIASNDTAEGRAQNRRVEVSILRNFPK